MAAGDRTLSLIAQVRTRISEPSEQAILDTEVLAYLNEAQLDLCLQCEDACLGALGEQQDAALTLDELPYALPADLMRPRVLTYKSVVARYLQVADLGAIVANPAYFEPKETRPLWYMWDGSYIWIRAGAKTAGSYHLDYLKTPTDMSLSVDPTLPSEFDTAMVTFATMRVWESWGEFDESERLWGEYLDGCAVRNSRYTGARPFDGVPGARR